jgi:hypothetical protein
MGYGPYSLRILRFFDVGLLRAASLAPLVIHPYILRVQIAGSVVLPAYLERRFALTKLLRNTANPMAGISAPGGRW